MCVQAVQSSTVISNGVGTNLSINPLYAGPYGILVSNVDFGQASVPYGLSGVAPKVSSFFTFWNVKVNRHARTLSIVQGTQCHANQWRTSVLCRLAANCGNIRKGPDRATACKASCECGIGSIQGVACTASETCALNGMHPAFLVGFASCGLAFRLKTVQC